MPRPRKPTTKRRKRVFGLQWLVSSPEKTLAEICARLIAGETLSDIAQRYALGYMDLALWIEADEARRKRYIQALDLARQVKRDRIAGELEKIIEADMTGLFDADWRLKDKNKIPPLLRKWLHGFKTSEHDEPIPTTVRDVKFSSKVQLYELLMKHMGMLTQRIEIDRSTPTGPVRVLVEYAEGPPESS